MASAWVLLVSLSLPSLSICKLPEIAVAFDHIKHGRALQENDQPVYEPLNDVEGNINCDGLTAQECEGLRENAAEFIAFANETVNKPEGFGFNFDMERAFLMLLILFALIWPLVLYCIYKSLITNKRPSFQYNPAYDDFETARAGDTVATAKVITFWAPPLFTTLLFPLLFAACTLLGTFVNTSFQEGFLYIVLWLVIALVFAKWRGDLRKKFFVQDGNNHFTKDLLIHCCCSPCALGQEAVELDRLMGVETGCCGVEKKPPEGLPLVGVMG